MQIAKKNYFFKYFHFYRTLTILLVFLSFTKTNAQQFPQFTQYMYNTITINPAYTNGIGGLDVIALHRNQWSGTESSPKTYMLTLNKAIKDEKMNVGLSTIYDEDLVLKQTNVNVDFSYGIPFGYKKKITFGIKAGIKSRSANFDNLNFYQENDPTFENDIVAELKPNLGLGTYFNSEKLYVGLSLNNLFGAYQLNTNIQEDDTETEINYFLTAGYVYTLNSSIKLKPAFLVKYLKGNSPQLDFSLNTLIFDKAIIGIAHRYQSAISGMLGFYVSDSALLGFSYDRDTSEISSIDGNYGTFELFIRLNLFKPPVRFTTPRFF